MGWLWPDLDPAAASNDLRQALYVARRTIGASRYLQLQDETVALCPDGPLWVDVDAFVEAAGAARRARNPAAYRVAIELYTGDLLPGDLYEGWTELRREELRWVYLSLLVELAGLYEEREDYGPAIEALGRVVTSEPAYEAAQAGLMRLYALSGQRGEALRQYGRLIETLSAEEFGGEPGAETRRLYEDISAGVFPPARPLIAGAAPEEPAPSPHNLPVARTSFVGREREMVEVKRLLAMTGLLTFTGAGGSGKTRLAVEVARDLVGSYPDGVWLVELAPLSDPDLVPGTVAGVLGVREQPNLPLTDTLAEALKVRKMLLVLDNCEHLIEACARLTDVLLGSCPGVRLLATSREPLSVAGEVVWPVPPLSVPDAERPLTLEGLNVYESARLFVERALYRPSAFVLTAEIAQAVAEICQQLEGIPLAIELAAARVGTLAVSQISERLGDSLRLLTGGDRTATPRQQTLRGALDWSYDLLSEPEKKLFCRLSAFAGGWTLEAAETVGADEGVEEGDILDLLGRLVDKSLVVAEAVETLHATSLRYRFLEPVRQDAREKLEESGEAEKARRRHAEHYLALAGQAERELYGSDRTPWLDMLETEHDNIRAALVWSLDGGGEELGLQLVSRLWLFWSTRGYLDEGRGWLEKGVTGSSAKLLKARALEGASFIAFVCADRDKTIAESREGNNCKYTNERLSIIPKTWKGTVSGSGSVVDGVTETWTAQDVSFKFDSYSAPYFNYTASGDVSYSISGTDDGGCTWSGSGTTTIGKVGQLHLHVYFEHYNGWGVIADPVYTITISCPNGGDSTLEGPWNSIWLHTGALSPLIADPFGVTELADQANITTSGGSEHWEWDLQAE